MKLFYTGPAVNAEMPRDDAGETWHRATQAFMDPVRRTTAI